MKKQKKKWRENSEPLGQPETFQYPNHRVSEGEEQQQEIENLLEQIMKETSPNRAKEIDFQKTQRVPKKLDPKRNAPRHIIIKLPKIKYKERILKEAREKETVTYKGVPIRLSADFSKETLQASTSLLERSIQSHEKWGPTTRIILCSKAII